MGLLSSRNGSSEVWFTLQDEPVHDTMGENCRSGSTARRGRGLVKLVESPGQRRQSLPTETAAAATGFKAAQFTRASHLERWNARATSMIGASRFGALALSAVIVVLAVAVIGSLTLRGGSDHAVVQPYRTQITRLTTERDRAVSAAAQEGRANAATQTQLERWRSLAIAEQGAARVRWLRARHNHRRGGSR
jgi:hypothetical protein